MHIRRRRLLVSFAAVLAMSVGLTACSSDSSDSSAESPAAESPAAESPAAVSESVSAAPSASAAPAVEEDLRPFQIATWGGTTGKAFGKTWGKSFNDITGVEVDASPIMDYAAWSEQIKSGNPGWDWGDFEAYFPIGNGDLFLPIDKEALGVTQEDMVDLGDPAANAAMYSDKTVGSYISSYVLLYDSKTNPKNPSGFAEVFDQKKFPGVVSLYNYPYGMIEVALIADGVTWDQMYPLDYERAFKKLDSLGDNLVFSNTGAEAQQQLASGAADWVVHWNMRGLPLAQQGFPVAVDWKDNILIQSSHAIPANTNRPNLLTKYIANALTPENQAAMANATATGPTVKAAFELIDEDVKPWVATNPDNLVQAAGLINDVWWAENFGAAYEKWNAWQASRG